ncbi:MAG TPA: hypothetical protein VF070_45095 [Streptosporangiaceae bacterium]
MYDMYPWDTRADGPRTRPPAPRPEAQANSAQRPEANPAPRDGNDPSDTDPATRAVQVALDRRDNGGDAADQAAATAIRQ